MTKYNRVKLQAYIHEPKQIIIETVECKEWDEIVVAAYSFEGMSVSLEELMDSLSKAFPNKRVLMLPKQANIDFYGFKEVEDSNDS